MSFIEKTMDIIKKHRIFLIFFSLLFIPYFIWWLAFYPGIMTADSLDQWRQALAHQYNDAHPFTSTLLMNAFRWIHDTPAWVSLIQVVVMSGMMGWILAYAYQKGIQRKLLVCLVVFFLVWPAYGIYTVTIWKDILYSLTVVALSLVAFVIIIDKRWQKQLWSFILLGILCGLSALLRHNGVLYLFLPFICLFVAKPALRLATLKSFGIAIGFYAVMHIGIAHILHVQKTPLPMEWIRMKTVAAVYHEEDPNISPEERRIFASLMPEDVWREAYKCLHTDTTAIKFNEYHPREYTDPVYSDPRRETAWKKAVVRVAIKNPDAMAKDRICVTKVLFGSEAGFYKYANAITVREDLPKVIESPKANTGKVKTILLGYLDWSAKSNLTNFIFWSAIPYAAVTLWYLGLALRNKYKATAAFAILMIANPLLVNLIGASSDYRYIYSLILGGPLIWMLYSIEKKNRP